MFRMLLCAGGLCFASFARGDEPTRVIVATRPSVYGGDRNVTVVELLPAAIANDLQAAGARLASLPDIERCIWNSQLDSPAAAMWVERLGQKHGQHKVLDQAGYRPGSALSRFALHSRPWFGAARPRP